MYQEYLVTGACYPAGKLVAMKLAESGCKVRVLLPAGVEGVEFTDKGIEVFKGSVFDKDSMKEFFQLEDSRHSAIIHCDEVVSISENTNLNMRRINVSGTQNIIDQCVKYKIGRIVWLGSAYALNPKSRLENSVLHFDRNLVEGEYAKTKAEAGAYIIEKTSLNKLSTVMLLPTFIIGPGYDSDSDLNKMLSKYLENGVSTVPGGHAFVDVRDVAEALLAICEHGEVGGCYIVNGEYKSSEAFFDSVKQASGSDKEVKAMSKWMSGNAMAKFVDTYYRITKKDNPKEVYAIFRNNPDARFKSTVSEVAPDLQLKGVDESLKDTFN